MQDSGDDPTVAEELRSAPPAPRWRWRALLIALLIASAGAAVAVLVPVVTDHGEPVTTAPRPGGAPTAPAVEVFAGPPRGSLAGDAAFVDADRRLPWTAGPADPPVVDPPLDSRRVVLATDVPGGRWTLVVGRNTAVPQDAGGGRSDLAGAWFTGPAGAAPEQLGLSNVPYGISPTLPMALVDPRAGVLVVVAAPGDVVEVSERPVIDADGEATRSYSPVGTVDGVAVVDLPPSDLAYSAAVAYQVVRDGALVVRTWPDPVLRPDPPPAAPVAVDFVRGMASSTAQEAARSAAEDVLALVGLPRSAVRVAAQWAGDLPLAGGAGAVVTVTLPSGAVVVTVRWLLPQRDGLTGADCGQEIQPAGPPAEQRVFAAVCTIIDPSGATGVETVLLVVGPPDVVAVRAYAAGHVFLAEYPAAGGVLLVPLERRPAAVEGVTDGGVGRGRVDLLGLDADFGN